MGAILDYSSAMLGNESARLKSGFQFRDAKAFDREARKEVAKVAKKNKITIGLPSRL
jgi:hypothetical protein